MTIKAQNIAPLSESFTYKEGDNTKFVYQANANLYVEGNPYKDELFTQTTFKGLEISVSDMPNLQSVTETQINAKVAELYPNT